jgi:hypothetical protein
MNAAERLIVVALRAGFPAAVAAAAAIFPEVQSDLRTFGSGPISKLGKEAIRRCVQAEI